MTTPTATDLLARLRAARPRPTAEAPRDRRGLFGLYDHTGTCRGIGAVSSTGDSLHARLNPPPHAGPATTLPDIARLYSTGRMWRQASDPIARADGEIAEALRAAFVARHCGAAWIPLPDHAPIRRLEAELVALAPAPMTAWNRPGTEACEEPVELVDALIESLALSPFERAALGRQRARFLAGGPAAPLPDPVPGPTSGHLPALPAGPLRFVALDVETANHDRGSICQIGLACVRPDDRIESWVTLVDPRTDRWVFSGLHGITAETVRGAPTIGTVLEALETRLSDCPVYQHSGFDRSAIRAACAGLGRTEPAWTWQNSVTVARAAWPELKGNGGHGLAALKTHLGLHFEHHDAGEDARAAAEVVLQAERRHAGVGPRR